MIRAFTEISSNNLDQIDSKNSASKILSEKPKRSGLQASYATYDSYLEDASLKVMARTDFCIKIGSCFRDRTWSQRAPMIEDTGKGTMCFGLMRPVLMESATFRTNYASQLRDAPLVCNS